MQNKSLLISILALLLSSLFSCQKAPESTQIMIASDLHFLSDDLTAKEGKYIPQNITSDGRMQEADDDILNSLIDTVNKVKPKALVISGDLTYNGEKASHISLRNQLRRINPSTKILLTPGNHDIESYTSYDYSQDKISVTDNVTAKEFKDIYYEFGYKEALYQDENSLSYIYELNKDQWIVVFDSAMYYQNEENGFNTVGGYIKPETISWVEPYLKYAQENKINVISTMHHNLFLHNSRFTYGYQLYNYQEVISLFAKYDIKINLSGHLHIQSIISDQYEDKEIIDLASNSLGIYGNTYGILDYKNDNYEYNNYFLEVPSIEDFSKKSLERFIKMYAPRASKLVPETFDEKDKELLINILSTCNAYYFSGRLYEIKTIIEENKEIINRFKTEYDEYEGSFFASLFEGDLDRNNISFNVTKSY